MTDDPIIEIRDVQCAVRPQLDVDRPEPRVVAVQEVGLDRMRRGTLEGEAELVDAVGDHVADEGVAAILFRKVVGGVDGDAGDGRRIGVLLDRPRGEAEAVVGLAEALVVAAAQEFGDRFRLAITGIEVAQGVEGQAERVDLTMRDVFEARAVRLETVDVARLEGDGLAVAALDRGLVGKAVAGVDPTVEAPREVAGHAVRVLVAVLRVQHGALVRLAVAVRVAHPPDAGNAVDDGALRLGRQQRQHADGNVELVGEGRDLARLAVGGEVLQHLDGVLPLELAVLLREGVLDGLGDPQTAAVVEIHVDRFMDVRLGGDELDLEAGRQMEQLGLVGRRARLGVGDVFLGGEGPGREQQERQRGRQEDDTTHRSLGRKSR